MVYIGMDINWELLSFKGTFRYWADLRGQIGKSHERLIEPISSTSESTYLAFRAPSPDSHFSDLSSGLGLEKKLTLSGIPETNGALAAFSSLGHENHWIVLRTEDNQTVFDLYLRKDAPK